MNLRWDNFGGCCGCLIVIGGGAATLTGAVVLGRCLIAALFGPGGLLP